MKSILSLSRYLKPRNVRNRIVYLRWYNFIEEAQWWTKEANDLYQWQKVKALLRYSYENIPYYSELFGKLGATPDDIKGWSDFRQIPYLTKEILRERTYDLMALNRVRLSKLRTSNTSGTTGQPLVLYQMPDNDAIERAFIFQQWKRVGYQENNVRVILRGEPVKNDKLFERYRFTNDWLVSSYKLSKHRIKEYVDFLNDLKPEFLHVYPSSLYLLTQLLIEADLPLEFNLKAILSGSEPVYDYQRYLFEKTFNTRVFSWLGLAEGTTLACECEYNQSLHVWPQYSYVELIDDFGKPVEKNGDIGSIIGTTFNFLQTPLIRYKSGDLASYGGDICKQCGRNHLLFDKVEGRDQLFIFLKDGCTIPFRTIGFIIKKIEAYKRIKMVQMIQEEKGKLIIKLNVNGLFNRSDEAAIREKINIVVNSKIEIIIEYTEEFVRSKSGKNLEFIQKIPSIIPLN